MGAFTRVRRLRRPPHPLEGVKHTTLHTAAPHTAHPQTAHSTRRRNLPCTQRHTFHCTHICCTHPLLCTRWSTNKPVSAPCEHCAELSSVRLPSPGVPSPESRLLFSGPFKPVSAPCEHCAELSSVRLPSPGVPSPESRLLFSGPFKPVSAPCEHCAELSSVRLPSPGVPSPESRLLFSGPFPCSFLTGRR